MVSPPAQLPSPVPSNASSPHHPRQSFSALAEARAPSAASFHSQQSYGHSRSHSRTQSQSSPFPPVSGGVNGYFRPSQFSPGPYDAQITPQPAHSHHPVPFAMSPPFASTDIGPGSSGAPISPAPSSFNDPPVQGRPPGSGGLGSSGQLAGANQGMGSDPAYGVWHAGMETWQGHSISAPTSVNAGSGMGFGMGRVGAGWAQHPGLPNAASDSRQGAPPDAPIMGPPPLPFNTSASSSHPPSRVETSTSTRRGETSRDRRRRGRSRAREREKERERAESRDVNEGADGTGAGSTSRPPRRRDGSRKDRDRDRDRDGERDVRGEGKEEDEVITTIFVVGFPEDMTEREFQNMFTFASGFEAATLKLPPGTLRRDGTAALLDQLQGVAAARAAAVSYHQHHGLGASDESGAFDPSYQAQMQAQMQMQLQMEEALATLSLGGTASTSSATTPSAAMSMTPSAPSGPLLGLGSGVTSAGGGGAHGLTSAGLSGLGPGGSSAGGSGSAKRRQTIGFARFRTRADALMAREVLQGKRIESLPSSISGPSALGLGLSGSASSAAAGAGVGATSSTSTLKAEMANKNLHAKRGTASTSVSSIGALAGAGAGQAGGDEATVAQLLRSGRLNGLGGVLGLHALQQQQQQGGPAGSRPAAYGGLTQGQGTGQAPAQGLAPSSAVSAKEAWDAWGPAPGTADPGVDSALPSALSTGALVGMPGTVGEEDTAAPSNSAIPIPGRIANPHAHANGISLAAHSSLSLSGSGSGPASSASASASIGGASVPLATPSSAPNGLHAHAHAHALGINPLHPVRSNATSTSNGVASANTNGALSPTLSATNKSPASRAVQDSKALLALAEEQDEMDWSIGMGIGMGMGMGMDDAFNPTLASHPRQQGLGGFDGHTHRMSISHGSVPNHGPASPTMSQYGSPLTAGFGGPGAGAGAGGPLAFGQTYGILSGQHQHQHQQLPQGYVPGYAHTQGSDALSDAGGAGAGLSRLGNPADQNPPINTLYVGNLPAISPPTHPSSYLEDSLRALFQQSPGFKRMSFRQKINGPMCFVEYEDVGFASKAIRDLYGNGVNGLVKGGIRLSYSKNSLGQRGGSHPPPSTLPLSLMNHQHPHHAHPHSPTMTTAIPTAMFTGLPPGLTSPHAHAQPLSLHTSVPTGMGGTNMQQQQQYAQAAQLAQQQQQDGQQQPQSFSSLALSSPPPSSKRDIPGVKEGGLSPTAAPFKIPTDPTSPRARFAAPVPASNGSGSGSGSGSVSGAGSLTSSTHLSMSGMSGLVAMTPRSPPVTSDSMSGLAGLSAGAGSGGLTGFPPLPGQSSAFSPTMGNAHPLGSRGGFPNGAAGSHGGSIASASASGSASGSFGAMSPTSPGRQQGAGVSFGGWVSSSMPAPPLSSGRANVWK